jgi:hypothetical protein
MILKHFLSILDDKVIYMNGMSLSIAMTNLETIGKIIVMGITIYYTFKKIVRDNRKDDLLSDIEIEKLKDELDRLKGRKK